MFCVQRMSSLKQSKIQTHQIGRIPQTLLQYLWWFLRWNFVDKLEIVCQRIETHLTTFDTSHSSYDSNHFTLTTSLSWMWCHENVFHSFWMVFHSHNLKWLGKFNSIDCVHDNWSVHKFITSKPFRSNGKFQEMRIQIFK